MLIIEILKALLTPVIAVIATHIAYQQLALAKQKRDLELYDRRSKIFKGTMEFIRRVIRNWEVSEESLDQFVRDTAESPFFFGKDVEDYVESLYIKGLDLLYADKERPNKATQGNSTQLSPAWEQDALVNWFAKQTAHAKDLFKPYLVVGVK